MAYPAILITSSDTCANTHNTTGEKIYNQLEDGGEYNHTVLVALVINKPRPLALYLPDYKYAADPF